MPGESSGILKSIRMVCWFTTFAEIKKSFAGRNLGNKRKIKAKVAQERATFFFDTFSITALLNYKFNT